MNGDAIDNLVFNQSNDISSEFFTCGIIRLLTWKQPRALTCGENKFACAINPFAYKNYFYLM